MELTDYLQAFRRHWLLIAFIIFLAVDAAALVNWKMPKIYEANAMVFITADSRTSSSYENSQFSMQRVKSYPDLVYSPEVLNPVEANRELNMSQSEIRASVSATNPTETVYVKVTADANDADKAALLANLVASSLVNHIKDVESSGSSQTTAVLPVVAVPAVASSWAKSPNIAVNLALGALAGLSVGMLVALARSRYSRRICSPSDVESATGLPVLAQIAEEPVNRRVTKHQDTNELAYRELWTSVLLRTSGQLPRVMLLTSAGDSPSDGSGPVLRGASRFLASTGRSVCALDLDSTGEPAFPGHVDHLGFTEVLAEKAALPEASYKVDDGPLTVVPRGIHTISPGDTHITRRAGTVVKEIADNFEIVITHAGYYPNPIGMALVAPVADGVLILASYGVTTSTQLGRASLELKALGVTPLGVVLIDVPLRQRTYGMPPVGQHKQAAH
ncbi:Wzz/FepE/Etk N-terminal domain-containing protein [Arthrobacter roseus]|uniref:Wzz/FepE/Etk N-terminal domain-containing protein n=1 Tax=Arthrobacter roseus TaxID=136274 RepID=UPI0019665630|nr:Wzz/FepE/Etk N-terminal domain-containing protein [Arthrobacter roseus]MBM7848038.1 capsular polysaccharide biosynthesis protein [Arthrobacter roseus]